MDGSLSSLDALGSLEGLEGLEGLGALGALGALDTVVTARAASDLVAPTALIPVPTVSSPRTWHHTPPASPPTGVTPGAAPQRAGLRTATASWTVDEIERRALRAAARLRARGVAAGDRVVLQAPNSVDWVTTLLALIHLDASIVLLDDAQTAAGAREATAVSGSRWVLTGRPADFAGTPGAILDLDGLSADLPPDEASRPEAALTAAAWFRRYDAVITWSSGSTGEPRGVVRSGPAFWTNLARTRERMGYRSDDVLLPLAPFSHFYGLTLVLLWWTVRCSLVVAPNGRLDQALRLGADAGVTVLDATPPSYHTVLSLLERRPELLHELRSVRMWCVGGAPLAPQLADSFRDRVGRPLLDGYGSTEAGNVAMATPQVPHDCGLPLDGVEVQVVDDAGQPVAAGETGEIWVRSPGLMEGYLADDGTVVARPHGDVYRTADLGHWDARGSLVVLGRKAAVHRLGHTLYPDVIERRAGAVGRPVKVVPVDDERRGSALVFVVEDPAGGHPQGWRRALDALLPAYEQPNRVLVLPAFPLTATGKTDLVSLREQARAALPRATGRPAALLAAVAPSIVSPDDDQPDLPFGDRREALERVMAFLRDEPERVAEVLTEISPRKAVALEIEAARSALAGATAEVERYRPDPVPQLTVFMSSNVLLYSYVLYLLVPSLFTERVAFRPSSQVGRQTRLLHELLAPVHRLPIELTGVSQRDFLSGPVAQANVVVFTGTYANAEEVRQQLRDDQLFLFFGQGVNPFIVVPDADLDHAVADAVRIRLLNSGQDCFAPDVFFVHEPDLEEFVTALCVQLEEQRYGDNADPEADYGPLCYAGALKTATDYLARHGDAIVYGGQIDFRSWHVQPTVVVRTGTGDLGIAEFFSPIFNVVGYTDVEELRALVTSSFFNERAMGAMVYGEVRGEHAGLVEQLARRHTVAVNETLLEADSGNAPFGGLGMMANYTSHRRQRVAEPILISKAVADHFRATA